MKKKYFELSHYLNKLRETQEIHVRKSNNLVIGEAILCTIPFKFGQ